MNISRPRSSQFISTQEEIINSTIAEYLLKSGFFKTVESLNAELEKGASSIEKYIVINDKQQINFGQLLLLEVL